MYFFTRPKFLFCFITLLICAQADDNDAYNIVQKDGSFQFGYSNPDSYHYADGNRNNVVRGQFGGRNPKTGGIDSTLYTAGPRGYRPQGKNIFRKFGLSQSGPRPVGSPDDPYYDPFEDKSYHFDFKTRTYSRVEDSNSVGDVNGKYTYLDDVGERHNVEFIAGKNTGFHVKTPFPDSNPRSYGPLYFRGRGRPIPRGRTSIQRGLDGSYKFVSAGPDQRRTEVSDSTGHVRGSYTYLDDKGVQHSVHYIAGPETGYRVLKTVKDAHLPTVFPFEHPSEFYNYPYSFNDANDVFDTAASGRPFDDTKKKTSTKTAQGSDSKKNQDYDSFNFNAEQDFGDDLFGQGGSTARPSSSTERPSTGSSTFRPSIGSSTFRPSTVKSLGEDQYDDGSYKPENEDDGSYKLEKEEDDGSYKPDKKDGGSYKSGSGQDVATKPEDGAETDYDYEDNKSSFKPPILSLDDQGPSRGSKTKQCDKCPSTIVTNIGYKSFRVPPGGSVRAHVQSIDLYPYETQSPSEALKEASRHQKREQLNKPSNDSVIVNKEKQLKRVLSTKDV
ncbi:hypothetical protein ABEB36_011917 [Hypothenemus hampei]|uniref:Uncharacterized protein n=1 Tax=Hypothenemus hampei TaxID=57062 RepID=A0ABD1E9Q3_HYPHA